MPRPPRLKSELDAASPVTARPRSDTAARPQPAQGMATAPSPESSGLSTTLSEQTVDVIARRKPTKSRVGPYLTGDQADRLRACYVNGWLQNNQGTFSDMLEKLLLAGVEQIEHDKNGGRPWPPISAGAIKSISQMNIEAERRTGSG